MEKARLAEALDVLWVAGFLTAGFVWFFRTWLRSLKEARTSEDIPTARIRAATQGYVELQGVARPLDDGPLTSPMQGLQAVWWRHTSKRYKKPLETHTSTKRFYIEDATGRCLIDPAGAEITPSVTRTWRADGPGPPDPSRSGGAITYTEAVLPPGARLYVRGEFRTVRVGAQPLDLMRGKLAAWRSDDKKRAILDVDRDGKLSETELEAARRAALLDAKREAGTSGGAADVVCKPADGRPFVITDKRPDTHARTHRLSATWALIGTVITGVALISMIAAALLQLG